MSRPIADIKRDIQLHEDTLTIPGRIRSGHHRNNVQASLDKVKAELARALKVSS